MKVSNYTRKMLKIELFIKVLLTAAAILVFSFLLVLVGYLSFRGLFIQSTIYSQILPDYKDSFLWPSKSDPLSGKQMQLWGSADLQLGKIRGDQLHQILIGKEKKWTDIADSGESITFFLSARQKSSIATLAKSEGSQWYQKKHIVVVPDLIDVAVHLIQKPGSIGILPVSWSRVDWAVAQKKLLAIRRLQSNENIQLPRFISVANQSPVVSGRFNIGLLVRNPEAFSEKDRAIPLRQVQKILQNTNQNEIQLRPYNWIIGRVELSNVDIQADCGPVLLQYSEYQILKLSFLFQPPSKNGKVGGISTLLVSSLLLVLVSLLIALPFGIAMAIYLAEYSQDRSSKNRRKMSKYMVPCLNMTIQTLSGIPSIVLGLFGSIFFVPVFGISLLSGAATVALMLLPTIILTAQEALSYVPRSYIEGSLGLGAQRWYTIYRISLPCAYPGILGGIILSIGRAIGETAALIYTLGTGYQASLTQFPRLLNDWPVLWQSFWMAPSLAKIAHIADTYPLLDLESSIRTVSLHLYWMTINGISIQKGYSTAFILILLIILLNIAARNLLYFFSTKKSR